MRSTCLVFIVASLALLAEEPPAPALVAAYKPPPDKPIELQSMDKAALYLASLQEDDGHWSAAKLGAVAPFDGYNGDVTCTALGTFAMVCSTFKPPREQELMKRAKRGMDWIIAHTNAGGLIADPFAPGDPVTAQLFAALTVIQATPLSTRETVRETAKKLARFAILNMRAKPGGFGSIPKDEIARMETTALASIVFAGAIEINIAFLDGEQFDAINAAHSEIEDNFRTCADKLVMPTLTGYRATTANAQPSWNATVSGVMLETMFRKPASALKFHTDYIFGKPTEKSFAELDSRMAWGKDGDGFEALALWQGTTGAYSLSGAHLRAWTAAARKMLLDHQLADGSWPAAGADAKRGKLWRIALNVGTLYMIAPDPPPQPPPKP